VSWCAAHDLPSLPAAPEAVALYLTALAERCKVSTLQRRISAISQAHQAAELEPPTRSLAVRTVMAGIRRAKGTAQAGKAAAVTDTIRMMVGTLPRSLLGLRDRALLLLGFAAALRRSKTDQEGQGRTIGIPPGANTVTCPVRALKGWIKVAGIEEGPLFRPITRHGRIAASRLSDKAVALVVKRTDGETTSKREFCTLRHGSKLLDS